MARSKEIAGKVERLELALARAKREFKPDHIFEKQSDMCELIGCTWPTLRDWINNNPALEVPQLFTRGGNGVRWQFHVQPFLSALLAVFSKDIAVKTEANAQLRRKLQIDLPDIEQAATLDETRKLLSMSFDVIDRRNSMGLYVRADAMCDFLEGFCRSVSDGIMGVGAEIDPTGTLEPLVRKKVNDALIGVQGRAHNEVQKYVEVHRARIQQARVSGGS